MTLPLWVLASPVTRVGAACLLLVAAGQIVPAVAPWLFLCALGVALAWLSAWTSEDRFLRRLTIADFRGSPITEPGRLPPRSQADYHPDRTYSCPECSRRWLSQGLIWAARHTSGVLRSQRRGTSGGVVDEALVVRAPSRRRVNHLIAQTMSSPRQRPGTR